MKVNALAFFNFCAAQAPLLKALASREGELSQSEGMRLILSHGNLSDKLPATLWRNLVEHQILVPTEPESHFHLMADPVRRLIAYIYDEANAATPQMIRGYIASLEAINKQLTRALEEEDLTTVTLSVREINDALRRIYADLDETHRCILTEVAQFKTTRQNSSVRDNYRRIVHWMERYVEPMIEIVRADGLIRSAFDETERNLKLATERSLFNDHPALERNLRYLRLVRKHALRVFQQCRKEIQPLYEALRRSSFIAEGAAALLHKLQSEGLEGWNSNAMISIYQLRIQNVPGDSAIAQVLNRLSEHPPAPAPVILSETALPTPPALLRRQWLDSLPHRIAADLPVTDLLDWMVKKHPDRNISEILSGFTSLVFHESIESRFEDAPAREYRTSDGAIHGSPVALNKAST